MAKQLQLCHLTVENQKSLFESFTIPVWVFDVDSSGVYWANSSALSLWDAESLNELQSRDMSEDMSPSVRTRLVQYQEDFLLGKSYIEPWTLYPKGRPQTFQCHFSGIQIEQGRVALLCMNLGGAKPNDSQSLHSTQALLLTSVMISLYDNTGRLIYANPSARSMLGSGLTDLQARFVDDHHYLKLMSEVPSIGEFRVECLVNTVNGATWHELTVQFGPDAVTGKSAFLISESDISERRKAQHQVHQLAYNDTLTGLVNRANLVDQLNRELKIASRYKQTFAVLFLDLDRFKIINDTLGHDVGDELLIEVANSIVSAVYETDTVARLGGDEFVCILRDLSGAAMVAKTATKVLQQIALAKKLANRELLTTASIGMSVFPIDGDTSDILMKHADIAMYQAKANGGNTAVYFDPEMHAISEARMSLEAELRHAQKAGEFEVYYQPRVNAVSEQIIAVEALLRWNHPQRGLLNAAEFITDADEAGILIEIDIWVLQQATQQQVLWRQQGILLKVSVNLSARQFKNQELCSDIKNTLQQSGCYAQDLELEITESVYMGSDNSIINLLGGFRQAGLSLAVDDFGTGYSNLAYLKNFPIDRLKIDKIFVQDDQNHALLKWIISLGRLLDVKLVAEGVETKEQLALLRALGCDELQGYYFSKPVDTGSINSLMEQQQAVDN
jgi:diguanylate cyclase (GGDEF)-like protein